MSSLLLEDNPIPLLPRLACTIGLNEAIVLQQIHYWTEHNREQNRNFIDGQYWVFNSYPKWREQFPWWSERTIQRILSGLEKRGLIVSGQYNKHKRDRTKWYRIDYVALDCQLVSSQSGIIQNDNLSSALPETTTENTTERRKNRKGRFSELSPPSPISQSRMDSGKSAPKQESVFDSVTEEFGYDRASYMLSVVDWYIDKAYPSHVKKDHPPESKAKRMVFAKKLLACSDSTVEDDQIIVDAIHRALEEHVDCDPTIYYITTPKVLGYWLIKDKDVGYESVNDTEYAPVDAMY